MKKKITLFKTSSSGSNTFILYKNIPDQIKHKYEIRLADLKDIRTDPTIVQSDVFITTHGEYPSSPDKINIELWHGFPLKGMANMDWNEPASPESVRNYWARVDLIMSYSPLYTTLLNSCMGARIHQYRITGMPRNDALLNQENEKNLFELFPAIKGKKIGFFLPTYRKSPLKPLLNEGDKNEQNIFGLKTFNADKFSDILDVLNMVLIVKLHPFEEQFSLLQPDIRKNNGIYFLTDSMLHQNGLDLYELLGASDLLITDYSSVYFDYLLLDKPIIFLPTDIESYRSKRGFLVEPYEFWAPGPKAYNQDSLHQAITDAIQHPKTWSENRKAVQSLVHSYFDNQSSTRVWTEIDRYIEERQILLEKKKQEENEIKKIQNSIKNQIREFIEKGYINEAKKIITEYSQVSELDGDIISMQGIILLLENKVAEAINLLQEGHRKYPVHLDIIYNLAYCYESIGEIHSAIHFYQFLREQTSDKELLEATTARIKEINLLLKDE